MNKVLSIVAAAVLVATAAVWLWPSSEKAPTRKSAPRAEKKSRAIPEVKPAKVKAKAKAKAKGKNKSKAKAKKGKRVKAFAAMRKQAKAWKKSGRPKVVPDRFAALPEPERRVAEKLQTALDADDSSAIMKASDAAMKSSNAEVRAFAVEAFAWQGVKALPELTVMMVDPDETVSSNARDAVGNVLTDIDDPVRRLETAVSYMDVLTTDKDMQMVLSGVVSGAAGELIAAADDTPEEAAVAKSNRGVIVDILTKMIDKGGDCAEQAKSTYEDVTGRIWSGAADAAKWVADPDAGDE